MKRTSAVMAFLGILCLGWSSVCMAQSYTHCNWQTTRCNFTCYEITEDAWLTNLFSFKLGQCYPAYSGTCPPVSIACGARIYPSQKDCMNLTNGVDGDPHDETGCNLNG